jgi:hypothetical protein
MSKRQVVVLWILAILLVAAAFLARSGNSKGFESKTQRARGATLLADFPATEVAKIEVKSGDKSTELVRKDGKWLVANRENYPANTTTINDFLRTLADVKVTDGIEAEPSFAPRFGMDPAATDEKERGTDVVLSNDAGTELARLTLGKNLEAAGDPMSMMGGGGASGRFVRNHADESGVYKVSEVFPTLTAEPQRWLDEAFLKIEKIKAITVSPAAKPTEIAWKVSRADEVAEFTLEGSKEGEALDTNATSPLKSLFSYARFDDVVSIDTVDKIAKPLEKRTVKIETLEGFTYTLTVTPTEAEQPKENDPEAAPPEEAFLITAEVTAEIPAERKKDDKESEDDAKAKDKAFADRKAELDKKLATEKAFAGRTFKVSSYVVEALLKDRSALIKQPEAPAAAGNPAQGGLPQGFPGGQPGGLPQGFPGGQPVAPPAVVTPPVRRPVEAVTPPIAIPPLEEGEAQPAEEKPEPAEAPPEPAEEPAEAPPAENGQ